MIRTWILQEFMNKFVENFPWQRNGALVFLMNIRSKRRKNTESLFYQSFPL